MLLIRTTAVTRPQAWMLLRRKFGTSTRLLAEGPIKKPGDAAGAAAQSAKAAAADAAQKAKAAGGEAVSKAKAALGEAAHKVEHLSGKVSKDMPGAVASFAGSPLKVLESPALQRATGAVTGFYEKHNHRLGKLKTVFEGIWHVTKVTYFLGREVVIREKLGPPRLSQFPEAKAEFQSLVVRFRPYVQDPLMTWGIVKSEASGFCDRYRERNELNKKLTEQFCRTWKLPNEIEVPNLVSPNIRTFLLSVFIAVELLTFFFVGEIIGRGKVIGYNVIDNRPKKDGHH